MKYETATHTLPLFLVPPAVGCFSWPECKNTEANSFMLCTVETKHESWSLAERELPKMSFLF